MKILKSIGKTLKVIFWVVNIVIGAYGIFVTWAMAEHPEYVKKLIDNVQEEI